MHGSNNNSAKNSATRSKYNHTYGRNHYKNVHTKQLHYTALCQNIQKSKGISICLQEKPTSTVLTHTESTLGHSEHRAQEEHGTPSPRENKLIVADFQSNGGKIGLCLYILPLKDCIKIVSACFL